MFPQLHNSETNLQPAYPAQRHLHLRYRRISLFIKLYRGWRYMIENGSITCLEQNFCVYEFDEHGTQITVPLKENGYFIKVSSANKDEYIELLYF
jgi:hypothetical protein